MSGPAAGSSPAATGVAQSPRESECERWRAPAQTLLSGADVAGRSRVIETLAPLLFAMLHNRAASMAAAGSPSN
jgi:hypothetical protein